MVIVKIVLLYYHLSVIIILFIFSFRRQCLCPFEWFRWYAAQRVMPELALASLAAAAVDAALECEPRVGIMDD